MDSQERMTLLVQLAASGQLCEYTGEIHPAERAALEMIEVFHRENGGLLMVPPKNS
jgi:hypothetical protein